MRDFITELRRRRVFRTAGIYIVGAWLLLQVADVLFPILGVPEWGLRLILGVLVLCFPLALIFCFENIMHFSLTPAMMALSGRSKPACICSCAKGACRQRK